MYSVWILVIWLGPLTSANTGVTWTWLNSENSPDNQATIYPYFAGSRELGCVWQSKTWPEIIWMFGGYGFGNAHATNLGIGFLNDIWAINTTTSTATWRGPAGAQYVVNLNSSYGQQGVPARSNFPGGRLWSSCWAFEDQLFLFGGVAGKSGPLSEGDLWVFNEISVEWTFIGGSKNKNSPAVVTEFGLFNSSFTPEARAASAIWILPSYPNLAWVFGGGAGSVDVVYSPTCLNDLWVFNCSSYQWAWMGGSLQYNVSGKYDGNQSPGSRQGHTSTVVDNDAYIFGGLGYDSEGLGEVNLNDLWKFSGSSWQWTFVAGCTRATWECCSAGTINPSCRWMSMAVPLPLFGVNGAIAIFGGANQNCSDNFADLLVIDLFNGALTEFLPQNSQVWPNERFAHFFLPLVGRTSNLMGFGNTLDPYFPRYFSDMWLLSWCPVGCNCSATEPGSCLSCNVDGGYYWQPDLSACILGCVNGYLLNDICHLCSPGCATCSGPGLGVSACQRCDAEGGYGLNFFGRMCVPACDALQGHRLWDKLIGRCKGAFPMVGIAFLVLLTGCIVTCVPIKILRGTSWRARSIEKLQRFSMKQYNIALATEHNDFWKMQELAYLAWVSGTYEGLRELTPGSSGFPFAFTSGDYGIVMKLLFLEKDVRGIGSLDDVAQMEGMPPDAPAMLRLFQTLRFLRECRPPIPPVRYLLSPLLEARGKCPASVVAIANDRRIRQSLDETTIFVFSPKFDDDLHTFFSMSKPREVKLHAPDIFAQIARGILYLVQSNVVHMDLRPHNIFVRRRRNPSRRCLSSSAVDVVIADWGSSSRVHNIRQVDGQELNVLKTFGVQNANCPDLESEDINGPWDLSRVDVFKVGQLILELRERNSCAFFGLERFVSFARSMATPVAEQRPTVEDSLRVLSLLAYVPVDDILASCRICCRPGNPNHSLVRHMNNWVASGGYESALKNALHGENWSAVEFLVGFPNDAEVICETFQVWVVDQNEGNLNY